MVAANLERQWRKMMESSFEPRQWFEERDWGPDEKEDRIMWVYRRSDDHPGLWAVGFYSPDREWHEDSLHQESNSAALRVRWLNGGKL